MTPYKDHWFEVSMTIPGANGAPYQAWVKVYAPDEHGLPELVVSAEVADTSSTKADAWNEGEKYATKLIDERGTSL